MHKSSKIISSLGIITILLGSWLLIIYSDIQGEKISSQEEKTATYEQFIKQHTVRIYTKKMPYSKDLSSQSRIHIGQGILFPSQQIIISNKHVVDQQTNNYTIDIHDERTEIVNIQFHPTADLAIGSLRNSTQTGVDISFLFTNDISKIGSMVQYRHNQVRKACLITDYTQDGLLATDCKFQKGQSGTPAFTASGNIVGLITATDNNLGYILPITRDQLEDLINR